MSDNNNHNQDEKEVNQPSAKFKRRSKGTSSKNKTAVITGGIMAVGSLLPLLPVQTAYASAIIPAALSVSASYAAAGESVTITVDTTGSDVHLNADSSVRETTYVVVSSPDDSQTISVKLTETDPNSGVFTGSLKLVDVGTVIDSNDLNRTEIRVQNNNQVTVVDSDTHSPTLNPIARTITRKDHVTGTVTLDKNYAVVGETVTITVNDADLITTTPNKTLDVNVASATYAPGIAVTLTEAGNTGVFTGTFTITSGASSAGAIQAVTNLEQVTVTYTDAYKADNTANATSTATMQRKDKKTGVISYERLNVNGQEVIEVSLDDTDLDVNPAVQDSGIVIVSSVDDVAGLTLTLTETGPTTGVFTGRFKPVTTATNESVTPMELKVAAFDNNMFVNYFDTSKANGSAGNVAITLANLQVPAITSITAAEAGASENGAGAGDTLTIAFDIATNQTINTSNVLSKLTLPAERSLGTAPSVSWTGNQTLVVYLDTNAVLYKGDAIAIDQSAGLKNAAGTSAVSEASHSIDEGSFGTNLLGITASDANYNSSTYRHSGQSFDIVFNAPTNKVGGDLATFNKLSTISGHTLGTDGSAEWQNSTTLRVTLGTEATVVVGDTVIYDTTSDSLSDYSRETVAPASLQNVIGG
ncbi:hypothetical protein GC096_09270, partial [Paenibacillus sp. LMG 31461]